MTKQRFLLPVFSVVFGLMGTFSLNAQVELYTINERYGWSTGAQCPTEQSPVLYDQAYTPFNVWQGGIGEPMESMLYFYRTANTPLLFSNVYDPYILHIGDLRFADYTKAKQPLYVDAYLYGRMPLQQVYDVAAHVDFSTAVSRNLSVGVVGNYMASSGVNPDKDLFNQVMNLGVWTSLQVGNYQARLSATLNEISHEEQNNLLNDTTQLMHYGLNFTHNWKFGDVNAPTATLIHTTRWNGVNRTYNQDSIDFQIVRNTLAVQVLRENVEKMPFSLVAFFEHDYRFHGDFIAGLPVYLQNGSVYKQHDNNLQLGLNISDERSFARSSMDYTIAGNVFFWGPLQSESNLDVDLGHTFRVGNAPMRITYGVGGHRDSNTKFVGRFYGSNIWWENSFDYWHRVDARVGVALPKQGLSLQVKTDNIHQPVYFGTDAKPHQKMGWLSVVAADLKADIDLHKDVRWENHLVYQYVSDKEIMALPDFTIYSKLFYHHRFNKWGLKVGVDVRYYTAYYANMYNKEIGTFHAQRDMKIGNYPELGVFAEVQPVKGLTVFAACKNWNNTLFGGTYYCAPGVHDGSQRLNVGLRWQMFE